MENIVFQLLYSQGKFLYHFALQHKNQNLPFRSQPATIICYIPSSFLTLTFFFKPEGVISLKLTQFLSIFGCTSQFNTIIPSNLSDTFFFFTLKDFSRVLFVFNTKDVQLVKWVVSLNEILESLVLILVKLVTFTYVQIFLFSFLFIFFLFFFYFYFPSFLFLFYFPSFFFLSYISSFIF